MSRRWRIAVLLGALLGAAPAFAAEVIQYFEFERRGRQRRRAHRHRNAARAGRRPRDAARHLSRLSAHLSRCRRHAARGDLQPARRHARRQRRALSHRAHARRHPHLCRRQGHADPARRTHLRLPLPHRTANPLVRRQARAQLERHRKFLALPDSATRAIACILPAARARCAGPPSPAASASAAPTGKASPVRLARSPFRRRGRCAPARASPSSPSCLPTAVDPPSANTLLWYELFDNRQWIIGGIGFLVVLIYYFAAWEAVGRDPRPGTIIPLFHPPHGISPALANYIHNWGLGREKWRAFTAAALSLAVRGLVHVRQQRRRADAAKDRQAARRRLHQPAARRGRDLHLAQFGGRLCHHRQGPWRSSRRRRRQVHEQRSKPKVAIASSGAISATSSPVLR